jgi:hypothetical protein
MLRRKKKATMGEAKLTIEEKGKMGLRPNLFVGTGTKTPLVPVPLASSCMLVSGVKAQAILGQSMMRQRRPRSYPQVMPVVGGQVVKENFSVTIQYQSM